MVSGTKPTRCAATLVGKGFVPFSFFSTLEKSSTFAAKITECVGTEVESGKKKLRIQKYPNT